MKAPADRRYLQTHEWHQLQGTTVTIGITQAAADELTDITFVQLPKIGAKIAAGSPFGEIESVKATADLMSGVAGEVMAVNDSLAENPGQINQDPFGAGWMIKVKVSGSAEIDKLLTAEEYEKSSGH